MRLLVDQRLAEAFDAWLEAFNQWIDAGSMINESFTIRAEKSMTLINWRISLQYPIILILSFLKSEVQQFHT